MENRYLPPARQKPLRRGEGPILHEKTSLSVLRVSNESHLTGRMGGENRFNVDYSLFLVITVTIWHSAESIHPPQKYRYGGQAGIAMVLKTLKESSLFGNLPAT